MIPGFRDQNGKTTSCTGYGRGAAAGSRLVGWLLSTLVGLLLVACNLTGFKTMPTPLATLVLPTLAGPQGGGELPTAIPTLPTAAPEATLEPTLMPSPPPTSTASPSLTPSPDPALPPACTSVGQTWFSPVDGMTLVCVPAGDFIMGTNGGYTDERPTHQVYLDAYWIDRTEVSNAQYAQCVAAGICTPPEKYSSWTRDVNYGNPEYAAYPVIYVDWYQASTYCQWAGRALPTEAQWEKAARGTDGREYPWGNEFEGSRVNFADVNTNFDYSDLSVNDGFADTAPVDSFPRGVSPFGALNMSGNVWEWVRDWYGEFTSAGQVNPGGPAEGELRILHGGSWINEGADMRATYRLDMAPGESFFSAGLRCAWMP